MRQAFSNIARGEMYVDDTHQNLGREDYIEGRKYQFVLAGTGGIQKGAALNIDGDFTALAVSDELEINGIAECDILAGYYGLVVTEAKDITVNASEATAYAQDIAIPDGTAGKEGQVKDYVALITATAPTVAEMQTLVQTIKASKIIMTGTPAFETAAVVRDPVTNAKFTLDIANGDTTEEIADPNNVLTTLLKLGDKITDGTTLVTLITTAPSHSAGVTTLTFADPGVAVAGTLQLSVNRVAAKIG